MEGSRITLSRLQVPFVHGSRGSLTGHLSALQEGGEVNINDKVLSFAGFWLLNSLVFLIFSLIWPQVVVFGNAAINAVVAIIWTGFILTVVVSAVQPVMEQFNIKLKKEAHLGLVYLVVNVAAIWVLARWLGPVTGFGIGAFYVAIILGIIINFAQWGFWKVAGQKQS